MESPLKVLIADDHPLILQALRRALEASNGIEIVGEARSGPELLALIERRQPEVVLLDISMPGLDGLACLQAINQSWPEIKTVVLSAHDDRPSINAALLAGATAYIVKSVSPVDIPSVLRQASAGAVYHAAFGAAPAAGELPAPNGPVLTQRETTILAAVARGLPTKSISRNLWVSEHTVKFHLTNIYRKLGVSNRSGAVRYAFEHDLVGDPE